MGIRIRVTSVQGTNITLRCVSRAAAIRLVESGACRVRDSRTVQLLDLDRVMLRSPSAPTARDMRRAAGEEDRDAARNAARKISAWQYPTTSSASRSPKCDSDGTQLLRPLSGHERDSRISSQAPRPARPEA